MVYSLNFFPTGYRDEIQPTLLTSIADLVPRFLTESTALNLNCFHSLRYYGNKDSEEIRYSSNKESESNLGSKRWILLKRSEERRVGKECRSRRSTDQ